jgi:cytochrome P450
MELDWLVFISKKGDSWREGRKVLDRSLRPGATISYRQMMQENTYWFLAQLLATPKEFREHIELLFSPFSYIVPSLTSSEASGKTRHVTHIWLRPKER